MGNAIWFMKIQPTPKFQDSIYCIMSGNQAAVQAGYQVVSRSTYAKYDA